MKVSRNVRFLVVLLATLNWVIPASPLDASDPARRTQSTTLQRRVAPIRDIALGDRGQLRGQVMDTHGRPSIDTKIIVVQDGRSVQVAVSDKVGNFRVEGLRGGLFQVMAGGSAYVCRGWIRGTAPPAAAKQLLIVPQGIVERGQRPFSDLIFSDPVMVGLVVAAAIAVPIAVSNSKSERQPGS